MKIDNLKYPDDFDKYDDAEPITNKKINEYMKECFDSVKDLEGNPDTYTRCGDTFIYGEKYEDSNEVEIIVCKILGTATIKIDEPEIDSDTVEDILDDENYEN